MVALHAILSRSNGATAARDAATHADNAVAERKKRVEQWRKDEEAEERYRRG